MKSLAFYLGDSIRTFFRRPEVRRSVLDVVNSRPPIGVEFITENNAPVEESVSIDASYQKDIFTYNSQLSVYQITGRTFFDVSRIRLNVWGNNEGITPRIKEVKIKGTEFTSTYEPFDSDNWNFNNCSALEKITMSDEVKYIGFPSNSYTGASISIEDCPTFQAIEGNNLVYIQDIQYRLNNYVVTEDHLDLTGLIPAHTTVGSLSVELFYAPEQSGTVLVKSPGCTLDELYINNQWGGNVLMDVDVSQTKFTYREYFDVNEGTALTLPVRLQTLTVDTEAKEMPYSISFGYSETIDWESIETFVQLLVDLDGTNGTTLWNGQLYMSELPPVPEGIAALLEELITRGAETVTYTPPTI